MSLAALELQSEGIYSVRDYVANAEVDEVTAREAVERSRAAWQKPAALLAALEAFRACPDKPGVVDDLAATEHGLEEHREVTEDLIRRVRKAEKAGASAVCLESDAFLL